MTRDARRAAKIRRLRETIAHAHQLLVELEWSMPRQRYQAPARRLHAQRARTSKRQAPVVSLM